MSLGHGGGHQWCTLAVVFAACVPGAHALTWPIPGDLPPLGTHPAQDLDRGHIRRTPRSLGENMEILPESDVIPRHYDVEVFPDFYRDEQEHSFSFTSEVSCFFTVSRETTVILLHIDDQTFLNWTLRDETHRERITVALETVSHARRFVSFRSGEILHPGTEYSITIDFTGTLRQDLTGLFVDSFRTKDDTIKRLVATQFQPAYARRMMPCVDQPASKATFQLTLVRRREMRCLSNMPRIQMTYRLYAGRDEEFVADRFQKTFLLSTYMLAFVVFPEQDFVALPLESGSNLSMRLWVPRGDEARAGLASTTAPAVYNWLQEYFQTALPVEKIDMVVLPDMLLGGMEQPGLITLKQGLTMFNNATNSIDQAQNVVNLIAHELAHQWVGNLVTPMLWDDLWLSEGLATFFASKAVESIWPGLQMRDAFYLKHQGYTMGSHDGWAHSRTLYVTLEGDTNMDNILDWLVYIKGAAVADVLETLVGEDIFRSTLQAFTSTCRLSAATILDLLRLLQDQSGSTVTVDEVWPWFTEPGYPLVQVTRTGPQIVSVQQIHIVQNKYSDEDTFKVPFPGIVPFTYRVRSHDGQESTRMVALGNEPVTLDLLYDDVAWIHGNPDMLYLRVNYDERGWGDLQRQIHIDDSVFSTPALYYMSMDARMATMFGLLDGLLGLNVTTLAMEHAMKRV